MTENASSDQFMAVASRESADAAQLQRTPDLRQLFDMHAPYVWNTLRRLGVAEGDLEDLTHDVFVQVQRHFGEYDAARPARPWLFGFAFRIASQDRRRARRRFEVQREAEAVDPSAPPDEQLAARRDRQLVVEALGHVPAERRAVFVLYEIDGVSMDEVARTLGIPLNTAYSRLRVARGEFAAAVRRLRPRRGER
jgi:RNA polymerase sigma-70 factor (ECF subfamily)